MKKDKDDNKNKGRGKKGPKPMKGARKHARQAKRKAKRERKDLLEYMPVIDRATPKKKPHTGGFNPHALDKWVDKATNKMLRMDFPAPDAPALKSPTMKAQQSHDSDHGPSARDRMHATDFGKRSMDKNPSMKLFAEEIGRAGKEAMEKMTGAKKKVQDLKKMRK